MIRIAYSCIPNASGSFTFYTTFRSLSKTYNAEIYCVSLGREEYTAHSPKFLNEGCVFLAPQTDDAKVIEEEFATWCAKKDINVVIPTNSEATLATVPILPDNIRIISRCSHITHQGYQKAISHINRTSKLIAISPRQIRDLVNIYRIPKSKISLISNGIIISAFKANRIRNLGSHKINLCYLGKLEAEYKGADLLPGIINYLEKKGVEYNLRVAGEGNQIEHIKTALKPVINKKRVTLLGNIPGSQVPRFLRNSDILLLPSRSEAFSFSLIEAMASGCVPVASRISGVTDTIIDHGENGYCVQPEDIESFGEAVYRLSIDKNLLHSMQLNASKKAEEKFDGQKMVQRYITLINNELTKS